MFGHSSEEDTLGAAVALAGIRMYSITNPCHSAQIEIGFVSIVLIEDAIRGLKISISQNHAAL